MVTFFLKNLKHFFNVIEKKKGSLVLMYLNLYAISSHIVNVKRIYSLIVDQRIQMFSSKNYKKYYLMRV